ncbi:MAG: hypothetical protein Ct9H300mP6_06920 [Gammaproteobacteria bacterium]|nr:MAG: hypothetical protein Ct9H300mP6_06920 [Gammaproteobacteria bacterium]
MHERLERPEMLRGTTYKIKPPVSDHAMYITINELSLTKALSMKNTDPMKFSLIQRT